MVEIRRAAVLGAGVMGRAIAAHFANAGIFTYLLDRVPEGVSDRNILVKRAKEQLLQEKPAPLFSPNEAELIQLGNFEDDFSLLADVDWIVEAIVENESAKQQLLKRVEAIWNGRAIISSNTSGISIHRIVQDSSPEFQQHFLGTHFFNPPRYMKLLELIPTKHTLPTMVSDIKQFAEERLGKGVVIGKDTPNFIANRIGTYGIQVTLQAMEKHSLTTAFVDELTGPLIGRPKSATFRTLDLVGLDTYVHVIHNVRENSQDKTEQAAFQTPPMMEKLVQQGMLGEKTKQGFYRKQSGIIQVLNLLTWQYQDLVKPVIPALDQAKREKDLAARLRILLQMDNEVGHFLWEITKKTLLYAAERLPEIAYDVPDVDQAMRWGFNWELGPFELWDSIGLVDSVKRMKQEGESIPDWVEALIASGKTSFYQTDQVVQPNGNYQPIAVHPKIIPLPTLQGSGKRIKGNKGASLLDIGDDVACFVFHSPKQAIGNDALQLLAEAQKEVAANYRGLVITGVGSNFCVGANLLMMLMYIEDQDYDSVDLMIRQFQQTLGSLRYCPRPVVAAPHGLTLGGGVEMCLPADQIQASAETYMGLVEVGVGLIPAGGGCKEMLLRVQQQTAGADARTIESFIHQLFQTIGQAKVSTSARDAENLAFLRNSDGISMNRDFLLYDAKQAVLTMDRLYYQVPQPSKLAVLGSNGTYTMQLGAYQYWKSRYISEHDYKIASKLAYVLAGGEVPEGTLVSESYLLDLEREAFLSLIGEPKTQARIAHMLRTGKPLRN
jgi:3-hydroxyacyl-CoA dehydrogenase